MLLPLPVSASVALLFCALNGVASFPTRSGDQVQIDSYSNLLDPLQASDFSNAQRGTLVKRTACTSTTQCGGTPLLANQMAICSSRVCTAFCVAGYYLDTTTQTCKAYVCDMRKCTNVLPARSSRICISTTTCGFRCFGGYTWINRECAVAAKTTATAAATTSSIKPTSTLTSTKLSSTLTTTKLSSTLASTKPISTVSSTRPTSTLISTTLASTLSSASSTSTTLPISSTTSTVTSTSITAPPTDLPTTTLSFSPSVVITNGTVGMLTGNINLLLKWQSSGVLTSGLCGNLLPGVVSCYRMYLNSTGMLESPLPSTTALSSTATTVVSTTISAVSTTTTAVSTATSALTVARTAGIRARSEWSLDVDAWTDDEDLERYYAAFPEHHSGLMKRACVIAPVSTSTTLAPTSASTTTGRRIASTTTGREIATLARRATVNLTTTLSTTSTLTTRPIASTTTSTAVPTPTFVDTSRQRVELLSWPGGAAGTSWTYTWTTYLTPGVVLSNKFFHMWQILSRDPCLSGPVMTLSLSSGRVFVADLVPGRCGGTSGIPCPSMSLTSFWGRPISHEMKITYGPTGKMSYVAVDARAPEVALLSYNATGQVGSAGSIKIGLYRSALLQNPMSEVDSFVGGYKAVQVL